jgi:hypothetical protein
VNFHRKKKNFFSKMQSDIIPKHWSVNACAYWMKLEKIYMAECSFHEMLHAISVGGSINELPKIVKDHVPLSLN